MIVNKVSFLQLCLILVVLSCASCGPARTVVEGEELTGTIIVVGNHPFESLAVELENGTVVRLTADEELQRQLFSYQGKKVSIDCSGVVETEGMLKTSVKKFTLLSQ